MEPPSSIGTIGPFIRLVNDNLLWMDFGQNPSDAELDAHIEALESWSYAHSTDIGVVVILHSALSGSATQRRKLAALEKRLEEHDREHVKACAIVAPNALTRGLVTAVFWIAPPVYPYRLFEQAEPALAWVRAELGST